MSRQKTVDILYSKLEDYMQMHGYDTTRKFLCPNPDHNDDDPSAHILPYNRDLVYCFGCNTSSNIFHVANYLEGLPRKGRDFWTYTVPELCKRMDVLYEHEELSDEDKERFKLFAATRDAADIVCTYPDPGSTDASKIYEFIEKRGWKIETAQELCIGAIKSYDAYMSEMARKGWDEIYLKSVGLGDTFIFNENSLIFVVKDDNRRPRGFAARNMNYAGNGDVKYKNTASNLIYRKSELLYTFHIAKQHISVGDPLWIVEGYADVPALWEIGVKNIAAVGGTAFTDAHIELLASNDIYKINFMFDNDDRSDVKDRGKRGGQESLESIIENYFTGSAIFHVNIKELPLGKDPDEYIREGGREAFDALPLVTPFEWSLRRVPYDIDPYELAQAKIKEIAVEPTALKRDKMINILSNTVDLPKDIIEKDVEKQLKLADQEAEQAKRKWAETSEYKLRRIIRQHGEPREALEEITRDWHLVEKRFHDVATDEVIYKDKIKNARKLFLSDNPPAFNMGRLRMFAEHTRCVPRQARYIGISAIPNIGKSSFVRFMSWEMVNNNDDLMVLYFSLDDPFPSTLAAFLAIESELPIADISSAKHYVLNTPEKARRWKMAWDKLNSLRDRFIIKDITDGGSLDYVERTLEHYNKKYPKKHIMAVIDSFGKLKDYMSHEKEQRANLTSERIKYLVSEYDSTIIPVLEMRKTQSFDARPTLLDIRNTRAIEYDADALMLMHQEVHVGRDSKLHWWSENELGRVKMPIVEIHFAKNKISSYKDRLYMKFHTEKSMFEEVSQSEIQRMLSR